MDVVQKHTRLLISTRDFRAAANRNPGLEVAKTRTSHRNALPLTYLARVVTNACSVFVLTAIFGLCFMALLPIVAGFRPVVITSDSMQPTIHSADIVITDINPNRAVEVGTVIDFRTTEGDTMHRVVTVNERGFQTQGDANPTPDLELVQKPAVLGIGVYIVPLIGHPRLWIDGNEWSKLATGLAVLAMCTFFARNEWLHVRQNTSGPKVALTQTSRTFTA